MMAAIALTASGCQTAPTIDRAGATAPASVVVPIQEVEWQPAPPALETGAEIAVLDGDPASPGPFTVRLRMPAGYVIAPHSHPHFERVTVLEGIFHLGIGERFDPDSAKVLRPGSYFYLPPGLPHFGLAEGETIIQISADGPFEAFYVDPSDDPRH